MSTIKIERQLNMSCDQVKAVAVSIEDKLANEYGVQFRWSDNRAVIKGPGVDGECRVCDGRISIDLKLGFLLMPFRTAVEDKINSYLNKVG